MLILYKSYSTLIVECDPREMLIEVGKFGFIVATIYILNEKIHENFPIIHNDWNTHNNGAPLSREAVNLWEPLGPSLPKINSMMDRNTVERIDAEENAKYKIIYEKHLASRRSTS